METRDMVRIPRPAPLPGHLVIRKMVIEAVALPDEPGWEQEIYYQHTIQFPGARLEDCAWSTHQGSSQEDMEIMFEQAKEIERLKEDCRDYQAIEASLEDQLKDLRTDYYKLLDNVVEE